MPFYTDIPGGSFNIYDVAESYESDVVVITPANELFAANDTVPAGTPFTIGSTGATWRPIGSGNTDADQKLGDFDASTPGTEFPAGEKNQWVFFTADGTVSGVVVADGDVWRCTADGTVANTPGAWTKDYALTQVMGADIALTADVVAGTDNLKTITPLRLREEFDRQRPESIFIADAALTTFAALTTAGAPTAAEIKAYNDSLATPHVDTFLTYNSTNSETGEPTYIFHVDKNGKVFRVEEPSETISLLPTVWQPLTEYKAGALVYNPDRPHVRLQANVEHTSAADINTTVEMSKWNYLGQDEIHFYTANKAWAKGERINGASLTHGFEYIAETTALRTSPDFDPGENWTLISSTLTSHLEVMFPSSGLASTGDGRYGNGVPKGSDNFQPKVFYDTDNTATANFRRELVTAPDNGDQVQVRVTCLRQSPITNQVIRFGVRDNSETNTAYELVNIDTRSAVAGGVDTGNVSAEAVVTPQDWGSEQEVVVDLVFTWSGPAPGISQFVIEPAYNADGTDVQNPVAQGSLWIKDVEYGLPSEFATVVEPVVATVSSAPAEPLEPGDYILDSSTAVFAIELENVKGKWTFSNPNLSLDTNAVTITSTGDSFTDAAGVQQTGDFLLNKSGVHTTVLNPDAGTDFYVSVDRTLSASSPFISGGNWDATTNTPDLTVVTNQESEDGSLYIYNIAVSGTQDIGSGADDFEAGGTVTWFAAGSYRYDRPDSLPEISEQTIASVPATFAADADAGHLLSGTMDTANVTIDPVTNLTSGTMVMRLTASGANRDITLNASLKRPDLLTLPVTVPDGQAAIVSVAALGGVQSVNITVEAA